MVTLMTLEIPEESFPCRLINLNSERGHTRYSGKPKAQWRASGKLAAECHEVAVFDSPVRITALFRFPDNRVRDVSNLFPTVKALVDGVVDAGALQGDDDRFVRSTAMERDLPNGPRRVRLLIEAVS